MSLKVRTSISYVYLHVSKKMGHFLELRTKINMYSNMNDELTWIYEHVPIKVP
jgi:hypothetical protein